MSYFLAVDLSDEARAQVVTCIETMLRPVVPKAKWLLPGKLHLTLRFLGNEPPPASLETEVRAMVQGLSPFSLTLHGAGFFTTARAASVLWLGVAGDLTALNTLRLRLGNDAQTPFVPHVTLARAKEAGSLQVLGPTLRAFESLPFAAGHVTLYESKHLHYGPIFQCTFAGPDTTK